MMIKFLVFFIKTTAIFLLLNIKLVTAQTNLSDLCHHQLKMLESIPILQHGRVKPLYVHAKETLDYLTGQKTKANTSLTKYCLLSFYSLIKSNDLNLLTKVEHSQTKVFLSIKGSYYPLEQLQNRKDDLRFEWSSAKSSSYKKELSSLINKIHLYEQIKSGQDWLLYYPREVNSEDSLSNMAESWFPVSQFMASETQQHRDWKALLIKTKRLFENDHGEDYLLELSYAKFRPFFWAIFTTIIGIFALGLSRKLGFGLFITALTLSLQTVGLIMRILISGRAPITNMYETVLFSGFGALVISVILSVIRREKRFVVGGLGYNLCCLLMIEFAYGMLDPTIGPLVPVLRDNFWLSTHVTTIILSYAALALSWMLANYLLIKSKFSTISSKDNKYYLSLIYSCLKFGVVLLSAGIILGGVWADYSWGRFWGWDPKETWSLIVLLIYTVILHGRYTSWIPPKRFAPLTAFAFLSVMMAWFGVNYILASGLHSYGFSEGGSIFLLTFFIVQMAILLVTSNTFPLNRNRTT